jgi:RNase P/RNase MRP subunit p30
MTQKKLRNNEDENVLSTFAALADEKNVDLTFLYNKLMEDSQYTKLRKNQLMKDLLDTYRELSG